jgi:diaminohydroxyphosphoribosylaminopyrimidine deaminase/5-amino-6-(5-phosphoribosylamino)uracil reductase
VIAKDGRVLAEGWHARAGEVHAEVRALEACRESPAGATVYLSLEPCAHHGRTPPCADALVAARVGRVVAALEDPNPLVKGKGAAKLREAGVRVDFGLMAREATEAHLGFITRMTKGRPWMRLKAAASLDGRTALANGESQWITGEEARRDVHRMRAHACAMLTGIGTVRRDDPQLTVRHVPCERQPRRLLIDHRLEVSDDAKILRGEPPIIFSVEPDAGRLKLLEAKGIEVVTVPADRGKPGKLDLAALARILGERGFNDVMVETGAKLNGSLLAAGVIDEIVLYVAPMILGDSATGLFDSMPVLQRLGDAIRPRIVDVARIGEDLRITARLDR